MKFHYKITPKLDEFIRTLKGDVRGARRAGMINVVTTIEAVAKEDAPVFTSNLTDSGSSRVEKGGSKGTVTFSAPYAKYVHEGTGLYGPHKTKIVSPNEKIIIPKKAKALYWPGASHPVKRVVTTKALFWPGMKHPVHSIKGMKGTPFLMDAAEGADMEKLYIEGANNYLARGGR